ncbi:phosphonate C-P lyase system protein PhnG [Fuscovulum ytuae]|uniref:Phosphonate C-P lyase system protein PhnG n=1 Tax=Fuscovulum ytuae TaxID=3042299 RepID=A0ABY8Q1Y2_9RHOB|nr:phosphonate C-P lyase system protein PhnG [Fuscovulum sp. YMD61]WGV14813.1 phosphonate C-P lyase system protein PhnG [Fuscovulum sp. YMD61]
MARPEWLGLLARSRPAHLAALMPDPLPDHHLLRAPEIGAVMLRGRAGATGSPFNLGEMTVTRCSIRLRCGTVGHGYVQSRDRAHALRAAALDALLQTDAGKDLQNTILAPLTQAEAEARQTRAAKAAATKVEFFTLVRGEDA